MAWETIPQLFEKAVAEAGDRPCIMHKVDGSWQKLTFNQLRDRARRVSRYLLAAGLEHGDRACLIAKTRPEWPVADMGMQLIGVANVPIYPSSTAEQILYILDNSEAKVVFCEDPGQLAKVMEIRDQATHLEKVVVFDPPADLPEGVEVMAEVEAAHPPDEAADATLDARRDAVTEDDLASIVYTSGTTGLPKGVMLLQRCFGHNVAACAKLVQMTAADHHLSFLPLSHVLERTVGYYVPVFSGSVIWYAESQEKLRDNLTEVRPTFMTSVPRLYEKMRDAIVTKAHKAGGAKKAIFEWALGVGRLRSEAIQGRRTLGFFDNLKISIADKLVFGKIRAATGGRLRYFLCGGAPLSPELADFFLGAGVKILEGYGLTETAPILCANKPDLIRIGTVGPAVQGVEIKIAEDGEILARGDNVMKGYFKNPDATAEAIDAEGWFHTGDIGEITDEGCLRITDRKKNLLVLGNGKNVAPAPIEGSIINSPFIAQAVVLGDNERFVSALICPDFAAIAKKASEDLGVTETDPAKLAAHEKVQAFLLAEVQKLCKDYPSFEQPKKIVVLSRELSEAEGELTPTLKVKRKVVMERYHDQIRGIYDGAGKPAAS